MNRRARALCGYALLLILISGRVTEAFAQDSTSGNGATPPDAPAELNTDDGPHVYWQNDSTARVIYFCEGEVQSRTFHAADTLRFSGFCHDTDRVYTMATRPAPPAPDRADGVGRLLAVSDIHGEYNSLVEILSAAGVIDSDLRWTWGDGHLVIVGDVFDRGPEVTECLWLLHRLEQESTTGGGAVHYLLGNHELMVMRGDLRYVHERFTQGIATRSRFDYDDLFSADTELGRWLRTKHAIVRIDRTLFVHGGLLVEHLQTPGGFTGINELIRRGLDYSSLELYDTEHIRNLYGALGPLWHRGYTQGLEGRYEPLTTPEIDSVLRLCDVDRIVVGHSEQDSIRVFHGGRVVAIDVDVETLGGLQALLWQEGRLYRLTGRGEQHPLPEE